MRSRITAVLDEKLASLFNHPFFMAHQTVFQSLAATTFVKISFDTTTSVLLYVFREFIPF